MRKLGLGLVVVGLFAGLAAPAASPAATNFGADLSLTATGSNYTCSNPCTLWNTTFPAAETDPTLAAPITGVVVSYSVFSTGIAWTTVHLRVVSRLTPSDWAGFGASSPDVLPTTPPSKQTFPARVPITVGDYVALESNAPVPVFGALISNAQAMTGATLADTNALSGPLPADGSAVTPESNLNHGIALEATVEPDADKDGFGDETQDKCVGSPGSDNGCPLPVPPAGTTPTTPAKKKCKKAKKRSAVAAKKCKKHKK